MTDKKFITVFDKIFNIIKNFFYIFLAISSGVIAVIANFFNDFFCYEIHIRAWQFIFSFIGFMLLIGIAEYIYKRKTVKRKFKAT